MSDNGAIVFASSYIFLCLFLLWLFVIVPIAQKFKRKGFWMQGVCNNRPARKHSIDGNVQFVLWKAGEQGHEKDFWINFDDSWWSSFKEDSIKKKDKR